MKTDTSLPELLDRVTAAEGTQILRELQHKLDAIIARHHQEMQKTKPPRKTRSAAKSSSKHV
jgi:hypothetical protein